MAKLTMDYTTAVAQIVDQLGLVEPRITSERKGGVFHATIEVDLNSWVPVGFRGPREFSGMSSVSTEKAVRKAAHGLVHSLEGCGLVTINDFSRNKLDTWRGRVMDIAKVCKEVAEERDELERNCNRLKRKQSMLLAENARLKVRVSRFKKECFSRKDKQQQEITNSDNMLMDNLLGA